MSKEKQIALIACLVWTVIVAMPFGLVKKSEKEQMRDIALSQARGFFQQVVDARTWNASHGGVYVEVNEETEPNPYLDVPDRDLVTTDGKRLTLINPAYMTRQIAQIGEKRDQIRTHITSLKPLRPKNVPDPWEEKALKIFEKGQKEYWEYLTDDQDRNIFRYMSVLMVEEECLQCHAEQKYELGDIRGGISISFPVDDIISASISDLRLVKTSLGITWLLGLGIISIILRGYRFKQQHVRQLESLTIKDEFTGLYNRLGFMTMARQQIKYADRNKHKAMLLFIDIDGFRQLVDIHGQEAGDALLKRMAGILRSTFREFDVIARLRRDQFVVLAMDSSQDDLKAITERLEKVVREDNEAAEVSYELSVSFGSAEYDPEDPQELELLVLEADEKLDYGPDR